MKLSLNWIKDFVDLHDIDPKELANRLTMSVAEVEGIEYKGKNIVNVAVGKIIDIRPHPSSAKLSVVQIDDGNAIIQSVCGAPNLIKNSLIPFARKGGSLVNVSKITEAVFDGIASNGVLCSAAELGISDDHSGLMILPGVHEPGEDLKKIFDIDDVILDIDNKSLTHRPDLWGHYGFAREIAALYSKPLQPLELSGIEKNLPNAEIIIGDSKRCLRYSCVVIGGITNAPSPGNMQLRLHYCGVKAISLLVDLTNYIMLELGQPMHAFDSSMISRIKVDTTKNPVQFITIDSVERSVPVNTLLIYDDETPVAIAGIMGGKNSEITDATHSVFLESACFDAFSIRRSSIQLGLRTESSTRFEKSLDPELTMLSIKRFCKLLTDIQPNVMFLTTVTDIFPEKPDQRKIVLDKTYIDKYIGQSLEIDTILSILKSLDFRITVHDHSLMIEVPSFRATKDITGKADIIEEITRIYGYDNIQPRPVEVELMPLDINHERQFEHKIKEILSEKHGFTEIHSYIWEDSDFHRRYGIETLADIRVVNPQSTATNMLRASIIPSLLNTLEKNYRNVEYVSVYEIGGTFKRNEEDNSCIEKKRIGLLKASRNKRGDELFYFIKGLINDLFRILKNREVTYKQIDRSGEKSWIHPVICSDIFCGEKYLGYLTLINPEIAFKLDKKLYVVVAELDLSEFLNIPFQPVQFRDISSFPFVSIDLSFISNIKEKFENLEGHLKSFSHDLLKSYSFIDVYHGEQLPQDKKSITISFTIGSDIRTLTTEDRDNFVKDLVTYMKTMKYDLRFL